jgi:hypothetical protein
MEKTKAIELLGGSVAEAAKKLGVSYQAVSKWPDVLPQRVADRVLGVYARTRFPDLAESPEETNAHGA